ncbi:Nitrous oxide reductase accessory protein NosL [Desulfuromusa kysingii]|uniref:Nitrous oxide reductase accessory protein NosL n=1 Tax=Desulfuromusa kysingii TaxID=37625 RepID=A0A1H3W7C5_9BACT|nr:nitrous oxide reductase accessory protein NosL [Desulfuromusa kysingii]SDZ82188.1 Nitrous oxide reductase accessory protein NosL [Desulfuromusa kysingii]
MKRLSALLFILLLSLTGSPALAQQHQDQVVHATCSYCGMDRTKFGHSRMLVEYEDGSEVGTCSIHCMALEFANAIDRVPKHLFVADYQTGTLLTAETAVWVLGGDKQGVMTSRAKWAFAQQSDAEAFIASHGGVIANFDQAMKASYEDMYQDTQRIRKMRAMKKMKMKKQ